MMTLMMLMVMMTVHDDDDDESYDDGGDGDNDGERLWWWLLSSDDSYISQRSDVLWRFAVSAMFATSKLEDISPCFVWPREKCILFSPIFGRFSKKA